MTVVFLEITLILIVIMLTKAYIPMGIAARRVWNMILLTANYGEVSTDLGVVMK